MITEILNPFFYVREQIKDYRGQWVEKRKPHEELKVITVDYETLNGEEEFIVFEKWDKKIVIDTLMIATVTPMYPRLEITQQANGYDDEIFHMVNRAGRAIDPTQHLIHQYAHGYFEIVDSHSNFLEGDGSGVTMELKKPVTLPNGGRFSINGLEESDGTFGVTMVYREVTE